MVDGKKTVLDENTFSSTDAGELQSVCNANPVEKCVLKVAPVDTRGAVLLRNPHPDTKTDSFRFYFQNKKRSDGGRVSNVERDENNRFLIAYFDSKDGMFSLCLCDTDSMKLIIGCKKLLNSLIK